MLRHRRFRSRADPYIDLNTEWAPLPCPEPSSKRHFCQSVAQESDANARGDTSCARACAMIANEVEIVGNAPFRHFPLEILDRIRSRSPFGFAFCRSSCHFACVWQERK